METSWTFFIGGKFTNIDRLEGETKKRFSMRVSFILNALHKLSLFELLKYSQLYADLVLFGVQPSSDHKDKIKWLLGIEKQKPQETVEVNEVAFEDVNTAMTGDNIENVNLSFIKTENGTTFSPIGDDAFIHIPENDKEAVLDQPVTNVVLKPSSEEGKSAGVVLQIAVEGEDGMEIVELKTCADPKCDEPAPVLVTRSDLGLNVVVNPIIIEAPTYNEDEEIFGDPTAKNAFMIPDMQCYNLNAGEEPEEAMKACVLKRFASNYVLKMKLRSTRDRILRFMPTVEDPNLDYWVTDNRYGQILMEVRKDLAPGKPGQKYTIQNLKDIVEKFADLPVDSETMTMYRNNVLNTAEMKNGQIVDYSERILLDIFKAYDVEMFEGVMSDLINSKTFAVVFKWTEDDTPCGLDIGDENVFTLEPSRKVFQGLPKDDVKHKIFGNTCETPASCLLIFMESFIATVVFEVCKCEDSMEILAQNIFNHNGTEVKFADVKDTSKNSAESIQQKLKAAQVESPLEDIAITVKDIGKVLLMNARRKEGVTIATFPGEGNPQVRDDQRSQPYENVTHIRDVLI